MKVGIDLMMELFLLLVLGERARENEKAAVMTSSVKMTR